jgi:3-hydroxymyristoyl/3-hydroxydecanoyl-(acyl carrier protein) dehydratase
VEGKRVSLQQIEDAARRVDWVEDSATALIQGRRSSIAVAVVLSDEGLSSLHRDGKAALDRRLRRALAEDLEAVLIPRRIRYLTMLPVNTQGKVDHDRLNAAFEKDARLRPSVHGATSSETQVEMVLTLDPDLVAFAGHFPEKAILPGVALVHWVVLFSEQFLGATPAVSQLDSVKFMRILRPNDHLHLTLSHGDGHVQYRCTCGGTLCSKGRISLDV